MKSRILTGFLCLIFSCAMAQNKEAIIGKWQSEHGNGRIQIYKTGDKYSGKLVWLKSPNDAAGNPKKDANNPSPALRDRPVLGVEILKGFTYNGDGEWEGGTVYDPKSGKTYSCKMSLVGNDKLKIRGYIGVSMIGKTETWTKVP